MQRNGASGLRQTTRSTYGPSAYDLPVYKSETSRPSAYRGGAGRSSQARLEVQHSALYGSARDRAPMEGAVTSPVAIDSEQRTRRRTGVRLVAYIVFAALVISSSFFIPRASSETLVPAVEQYEEVLVQPGDTLWTIAGRHKGPRMDTREMIDRIRRANEMTDASVYPGKVLRIPIVH